MRRITEETKKKIMADWHVGKTQKEIAEEYNCSVGSVNKMCKGVEQKNIAKVNVLVEAKQDLAEQNEFEVNAVYREVNEKTKHIQFFNSCAVKNVQQAMEADCEGQLDFKHRADTIVKARETVLGKAPEVAVQINNKTLANVPTEELMRMAGVQ